MRRTSMIRIVPMAVIKIIAPHTLVVVAALSHLLFTPRTTRPRAGRYNIRPSPRVHMLCSTVSTLYHTRVYTTHGDSTHDRKAIPSDEATALAVHCSAHDDVELAPNDGVGAMLAASESDTIVEPSQPSNVKMRDAPRQKRFNRRHVAHTPLVGAKEIKSGMNQHIVNRPHICCMRLTLCCTCDHHRRL